MFSVLRRIFMPSRLLPRVFVLLLASLNVHAQSPELSKSVQEFVRANAPTMVLTHVLIESGKITPIEKGPDVAADKNHVVLHIHSHTVMPRIVGMHDHLFYIVQ